MKAPATLPGSAGQLEAGAELGGYRVEEPLRTDRLGTLHRAVGPEGGPVLLRVLAARVAEDDALRGAVEELLAILEQVRSPHVAALVERGEVDGRPFYALACSGRVTLLDLIRRGRPLEEEELAWLGRGLAVGLASLHAVGLAHGSLSAEHVVVTPEGPLIVDLGWSARLRPGEAAKLPSLGGDLRALGALLVTAATGGEVGLSGKVHLPARLVGPFELLVGDRARREASGRRSTAVHVARAWRAACAELGVDADAIGRTFAVMIDELRTLQDTEAGAEGPADLPERAEFGRYVLIEEVARGGMGVVYRARHADFERFFALKIMISGALADEKARVRFLREAESAASLEHPAIVRVHDCGEVEGRAYIAMDFAEGRPFSKALEAMDLQEELLPFFMEVVRAVHYAHSRGIVHRDLKPDNILVSPDGRPRILDFGVSKRIDEAASGELTLSGELVGTPAYMPPEQAEGRGNDIDTRSDVYALGATLYEAVTGGRRPFEGGSVTDILTRVLLEDPLPPSSVDSDLPWELDAIVMKALEKSPAKRYQSAAELVEDLERFLDGLPIRARQASRGYRLRKWIGRRQKTVTALAAATLVLLAAGGLLIARQARLAAERDAQVQDLLRAGEESLAPESAERAKERFVQALALDPANRAAELGRDQAERLLDERRRLEEQARVRARELEQSRRFLREGEDLLERGEWQGARRAFEQALAFDNASEDARRGLVAAERELARVREQSAAARTRETAAGYVAEGRRALEGGDLQAAQAAFLQALAFGSEQAEAHLPEVEAALDRERRAEIRRELERRDREEGARLLAEARAALEASEFDRARTSCLQALAFGSAEAEPLLQEAEEGLLGRRQEELRRRDAAEARRRVQAAAAALAGGDLDEARAAYLQALGFDGRNEAAREGLLEVDRRIQARDRAAQRTENAREARRLVAAARERLDAGRELFREDPYSPAGREAYLESLELLDRAILLAPDYARAGRAKDYVVHELAAILRDQGNSELADYLLRFSRVDEDPSVRVELPQDPHLVVVEASKVTIRRAFGGAVRFEPNRSRVFDRLREYVAARGERYRVVVQVRSRVTNDIPPQVYATGLWVHLEDREAKTVSAPVKIDFAGGPHAREVHMDSTGPVVGSFLEARGLEAERYLERVSAAVRELVRDARDDR